MSQNAIFHGRSDGDRLLFLARPPLEIVGQIERLRRDWGEPALNGATPVRGDLLHCTIAPFRQMPDIPRSFIDELRQVGRAVDAEAFGLTFNAVKTAGQWVRLAGRSAGVQGAKQLRDAVIAAISAADLQDELDGSSFDPHMTLLYGNTAVSSYKIKPLSFWVDELVLVRSHVGKTRHEEIARWRLQPPRQLSLAF